MADIVDADTIFAQHAPLAAIEAVWGPAPGSPINGRSVFILGAHFGNVFVGVQPTFGYEATRCACCLKQVLRPPMPLQFYLWLRNTFKTDAILHFWNAWRA